MVITRFRSFWTVILVALFVLVVYQTATISRSQGLDDLQRNTAADLNRYALSLQQELDRYKDLPKLLSSHSELINLLLLPGTDATYRANLYLEKVNSTIGAADTYLMDTDGTTLPPVIGIWNALLSAEISHSDLISRMRWRTRPGVILPLVLRQKYAAISSPIRYDTGARYSVS